MMQSRKFVRDNGDEIEADIDYRIFGGSVEIESVKCWLWADRNDVNAPYVTLTDDEDQRLYDELVADDSTWDYD